MITPVHDRILVQPNNPETVTKAGLIIPDVAQDKSQTGRVIRVGPGKSGIPLSVKENDQVMYQKNAGIPIKINGEDLLVLKEEEILGILS